MKLINKEKVSYSGFGVWFRQCGWELMLYIVCFAFGVFILLIGKTSLHGSWLCPFKRITGLPCPSCGMTRACLSFIKGDFHTALTCNLMVYFLMLFILYRVAVRLAETFFQYRIRILSTPVLFLAGLCMLFIFGITRIILIYCNILPSI